MIKRILVVMGSAALISFVCFLVLGLMGGFPPKGFGDGWGGGWAGWRNADRAPGPETTRTLPYAGSRQLEIAYPSDIVVTQGTNPSFTITGPQNILDDLQLEDGTLESKDGRGFGRHGWGRRYRGRLRIEIVSPNTHEFHLAGAQKLTLNNYDQDSLELHISGAGDVEAKGRARKLEAHISGAGHLDMDGLTVDDSEVSISGAGDASLDTRRHADVSISGAGHVRFKCRPADGLSQHISGFGSVDEGPNCGAEPEPPASSAPSAPAAPAAPAKKSNV